MNQETLRIEVGIAEFKISANPNILATFSLGSCVGIAFYDPVTKLGALAHIMLPDSSVTKTLANPAKFADSAINGMLKDMVMKGVEKRRLIAKIVGGAMMFESAVVDPTMQIGERNVKAVKKILSELGISLVGEDTGKNYGRTMELDTRTGEVTISSIQTGVKVI